MDRVARAGISAAARRWPADLAERMRAEWLTELAAVDGAYRKLTFAGSLAISPAVDEPSWRERATAIGRAALVAAGVTLVAAVATNVARGSDVLAPALLAVAAAGLLALGTRAGGSVVLVGAALFGFLLAGNPVPVMPFMGAADIAPAVATWMLGIAAVAHLTRRLVAAGHRRRAAWVAAGGGLVALDLATVAGAAHAAGVLGVPAWSAPAWFPLALLPGGTVSFGPRFADGSAAFGSLQASGPAFHASGILLANAAVMAGPLLLCAAFVLASALRAPNTAPADDASTRRGAPGRQAVAKFAPARVRRPAAELTRRLTSRLRTAPRTAEGPRLAAGLVAALVVSVAGPLLPASGGNADDVLRRMLDNSTAFGFGFVEHPVGLGAVALLAALLAMRATESAESESAESESE